jgi:hypothetical protein
MLRADLVKRNIRDFELISQMRERLGPDKFIKFLARENPRQNDTFPAVFARLSS